MKAFELKIKTGSGRSVTKYLGVHGSLQEAISEALKEKEIVGAVSFTVREYTQKVSSRKKANSIG